MRRNSASEILLETPKSLDEVIDEGLFEVDFRDNDSIISWLDRLTPLIRVSDLSNSKKMQELVEKLRACGYADHEQLDRVHDDDRENFIRPTLFCICSKLPIPTFGLRDYSIRKIVDERKKLVLRLHSKFVTRDESK
jgi:hypothetical protein